MVHVPDVRTLAPPDAKNVTFKKTRMFCRIFSYFSVWGDFTFPGTYRLRSWLKSQGKPRNSSFKVIWTIFCLVQNLLKTAHLNKPPSYLRSFPRFFLEGVFINQQKVFKKYNFYLHFCRLGKSKAKIILERNLSWKLGVTLFVSRESFESRR